MVFDVSIPDLCCLSYFVSECQQIRNLVQQQHVEKSDISLQQQQTAFVVTNFLVLGHSDTNSYAFHLDRIKKI